MQEADIRQTLRRHMLVEHAGQSNTVVIDEFSVCQQAARIDMAAINGRLHGYEIKSAQDTLGRLPHQIDVYNRTFDTLTLVLTGKHKAQGRSIIPRWWGIIEAIVVNGRVELRRRRQSRQNKHVDPEAVVQLLWRSEALHVLREHGRGRGLASKPKRDLWAALVASLSIQDLCRTVRNQLKARGDWRSVGQRTLGGGSCQRRAKSLHSRGPTFLKRIH